MMQFIDLAAQRRRLGSKIDEAVLRVIDHGQYIHGPEVADLEARLAAYTGATHAITCSSGTDALLMVLLAWGVGRGDAVFLPAFTFAATAEVVALLGATPVFVDVDDTTFNLDPGGLKAAVEVVQTRGQLRPAAVIAVDLFGLPADYDAIVTVAREHGMRVMADAAQSFGASVGGRRVGTMADATTTSFFPAKPLGCYGDGGAIFTDDADVAAALRSVRVHGQGTHKYENVRIGINGRLDTMQAAVLLQKLDVFDDELEARQAVAVRYAEALSGLVRVPFVPHGSVPAWAQYTITTDGRDELAGALKAAGVPTAVYYPRPLHQQPAFDAALCPSGAHVSVRLAGEVLSLPMHPYLHAAVQTQITDAVKKWCDTPGG